MYPLPNDFDETEFVGHTLYEIGFNANQIRLFFEPSLSIVVEGLVKLRVGELEDMVISPESPKLDLLQLIDSTVEAVSLDSSRSEMELRFNGDVSLVLIPDDNYESYKIESGGKQHIV